MTIRELEDVALSLLERSSVYDDEIYRLAIIEFAIELKGRGLVEEE